MLRIFNLRKNLYPYLKVYCNYVDNITIEITQKLPFSKYIYVHILNNTFNDIHYNTYIYSYTFFNIYQYF